MPPLTRSRPAFHQKIVHNHENDFIPYSKNSRIVQQGRNSTDGALILQVYPKFTDEQMKSMEADHFDGVDCILDEDVDVYNAETGQLLAKFRKNIVRRADLALDYLYHTVISKNRSAASGPIDLSMFTYGGVRVNKYQGFPKYADGTVSKFMYSNPAYSTMWGYYESTPQQSTCRLTSHTQKHEQDFLNAEPLIREVDQLYKVLYPEAHASQMEQLRSVRDHALWDTAFTSMSANKTFRTAIHQDAGNLTTAYGAFSPIMAVGCWTGCEFAFPKYGIAFTLRPGDLILANVAEHHCNLPFTSSEQETERYSFVFFSRENITIRCAPGYQRRSRDSQGNVITSTPRAQESNPTASGSGSSSSSNTRTEQRSLKLRQSKSKSKSGRKRRRSSRKV